MENDDRAAADAAFTAALTSTDRQVIANAGLSLGMLRRRHGDRSGAVAPTRRAINAEHDPGALRAQYLMGAVLHELGDLAGAAWSFEKVARRTDQPELAAHAAAGLRDLPPVPTGPTDDPEDDAVLGLELERAGDIAGATAAYTWADLRGSADGASNIGFFRLGWTSPISRRSATDAPMIAAATTEPSGWA